MHIISLIPLSFCSSGVIVYDYELKIGWGKSVALPSQALPAPPPGHMAIRNQEVQIYTFNPSLSDFAHALVEYF